VLDFGCGCGATTVVLARLGADVVGLDPDGPSIAAAALRAADAGVAAQTCFQHLPDPLHLPFDDGAFDAVLAYQVVEHIPPAARGAQVRELWRVIAPGGRLLLSAPNRLWPLEFHTTGLWWLPWLPERLAIRYAILRGRLPAGAARDPKLAEGLRGIMYWQVLRWLPAEEARVLNRERRDDLEAWLDLSLSRDQGPGRARAKRALHRMYRALEHVVWRRLGWPAAAFLPYLNLALAKRG
jgi:SAM-dependent methyltransferase